MVVPESPGSIRNQVGRSINAIRERLEVGDVEGLADQVAFLVAIASPMLPAERLGALRVPAMPPGRDRDGTKRQGLFDACMKILSDTLCLLSQRGIYAWAEGEVSDAADLALTDDEADGQGDDGADAPGGLAVA